MKSMQLWLVNKRSTINTTKLEPIPQTNGDGNGSKLVSMFDFCLLDPDRLPSAPPHINNSLFTNSRLIALSCFCGRQFRRKYWVLLGISHLWQVSSLLKNVLHPSLCNTSLYKCTMISTTEQNHLRTERSNSNHAMHANYDMIYLSSISGVLRKRYLGVNQYTLYKN